MSVGFWVAYMGIYGGGPVADFPTTTMGDAERHPYAQIEEVRHLQSQIEGVRHTQ